MDMQGSMRQVKSEKIVMRWDDAPLKRVKVSPISTGLIAGTYGMDVTFVYPEGYDLHPPLMSQVREECAKGGGKFQTSHDLKGALEGADIVYPRNWETVDTFIHTKDEELRLAAQHKDWKLTESLLRVTNNARVIHCMPVARGSEED